MSPYYHASCLPNLICVVLYTCWLAKALYSRSLSLSLSVFISLMTDDRRSAAYTAIPGLHHVFAFTNYRSNPQ